MMSQGSAREALLVLDAALHVRAANRAFYEMFRLAPEESVGRKVYELGGRAWNEKLRPMLETVLSGEPQSDQFELINDDKEGGHGTLWLSARLVPSADAGDSTVLLSIEDITTGRTVEETLAVRTKELNTFADMAGRAAHELNNLLTVIRMNADLIEGTLKESSDEIATRQSSEKKAGKVRRLRHGAPTGKETILLVDDEKALRKLGKRVLSAAGYRVLEASDGAMALRIAAEEVGEIDLVLTDVEMPTLGGRGMVDELHELSPGMRVLFMSGYTDNEILRRGIRTSETDFLQKPFTAEALCAAVRAVLSKPSTATA